MIKELILTKFIDTKKILNKYDENKKLYDKFLQKLEKLIENLLKVENIKFHQVKSRLKERDSLEKNIKESNNKKRWGIPPLYNNRGYNRCLCFAYCIAR